MNKQEICIISCQLVAAGSLTSEVRQLERNRKIQVWIITYSVCSQLYFRLRLLSRRLHENRLHEFLNHLADRQRLTVKVESGKARQEEQIKTNMRLCLLYFSTFIYDLVQSDESSSIGLQTDWLRVLVDSALSWNELPWFLVPWTELRQKMLRPEVTVLSV